VYYEYLSSSVVVVGSAQPHRRTKQIQKEVGLQSPAATAAAAAIDPDRGNYDLLFGVFRVKSIQFQSIFYT